MTDAASPSTLAEALLAFQRDAPKITKNATASVGKFSYEYATLAHLLAEVLPKLAENQMIWTTMPILDDSGPALRYSLTFVPKPEESITGVMPLMLNGGGPQDLGGALTYARRYAMTAVLGLAPDKDEDGAPGQRAKAPRRASKARAQAIAAKAEQVGVIERLQLAASHVKHEDVGEITDVASAVGVLLKLTADEAEKVAAWVEKKALEALDADA